MSSLDTDEVGVRVSVRNVGGIDRTEVELSPGVTALTGRNATNRTSLLRAVMAALGSDDVSLKADADEGRVEMTVDGETYTRTLERSNGTVTTGGDPYLEDPAGADLFAFLLETNEARRAVARGDDLRELIMRPVDTEGLEDEIDRLEAEKRELDVEIEELEALSAELPDLERERAGLEDDIEAKQRELADLEEEIDERGADIEAKREEKSRMEEELEELRAARNELEELRYEVDAQRRSLDALRGEREELEADREAYPDDVADEADELEERIEELRRERRELETEMSELQTVIQFNEEMLNGESEVLAALADDGSEAVTDRLVEERTVCWTCGTEVETDQIESTVDHLRELRERKRDEQRSLADEIDELETRRIEFEEKQRQRDQIRDRLREIEREVDRREERLDELEAERDEQADRVERLETEVEQMESDEYDELLELHREANELEFEIGRLEDQLADVESECDRVESRVEELDERRERRDEVDEELAELRTRIRRIEVDAVEQFNDHMAALLDLLDYDNLDRIWIERLEAPGNDPAEAGEFALHVVRSTDDAVTYEDTVDHLSESEREVTGLVFALAGYLVHDLAEVVPFMLLDSLEAIDSDRIAALVEYFADYADYLVVALLPEDAAALEDAHARVREI